MGSNFQRYEGDPHDTLSSVHKQSEMSFDASNQKNNLRDTSDMGDRADTQGASIFTSGRSEVNNNLRPTDHSIGAFMNLQFTSATECFHHFLKDGGIGTSYKEDSQKVVSTKLLDILGQIMQNTTECLMMQRQDNVNAYADFSKQNDIMAQFKKSLSSYKLIDPQGQFDLPTINDLD